MAATRTCSVRCCERRRDSEAKIPEFVSLASNTRQTCVQVRAAGLLAQLQVQRGAYDRAAGVHEALALRRSGPGAGEEVALQRRVDSLHDAVLQVRSWRTSSIDDVRSLAMCQTGEAPCCGQ